MDFFLSNQHFFLQIDPTLLAGIQPPQDWTDQLF